MTMKVADSTYWNHEKLYQFLKYSIYILILFNVIYFTVEDYFASAHTFKNGVSLANIGNAFSASVDSFAWYILLMTFELETYILEDDELSDKKKILFNVVVAVCYFFILLAFVGYIEKLIMVYDFELAHITDLCAIVGSDIALALDLDEYAPLVAENCANVSGQIYFNSATSIYADHTILKQMKQLSLIDVVNALTWLVIVLVLQIEVFLQLRGHLSSYMYKVNSMIKFVAYFVLLFACVYWAYMGDGIGFWDAILWLGAFIFIELNIFQWRQEEEAEAEAEAEAEENKALLL